MKLRKQKNPEMLTDTNAIFQKSCEASYGMVLKYCICMLNNEEDAKDCTQDTFKDYYERLLSGADIQNHTAYILKIAKHNCVDKIEQIRKYNEKISICLRNSQSPGLSIEEQIDVALIDGKIDSIVEQIIDSLTANEKALYYDYYVLNLTYDQIALKSPSPIHLTTVQKRIMTLNKKIRYLIHKAVSEGGVCK